MEELRQITVKVSSRYRERKKYDSLLAYATAELNKMAKSLYDEYRFINVIPTMTTDNLTLTDYCELTAFLAISKDKNQPLKCKYSHKCLGIGNVCLYATDAYFIEHCKYINDPEACKHSVLLSPSCKDS